MHLLDLTVSPPENETSWLDEFQQGLEASKDHPRKLYHMQFEYSAEGMEERSYVLETMSKGIWLRLGSMNLDCHTTLVELLEEAFRRNKCNQLLVRLEEGTEELIVTRTDEDPITNRIEFFFASSH